MTLTTSPECRLFTGYFCSTFSHGLGDFCLRPRAIFSFSLSTWRMYTSSCWSILTISWGLLDSAPAHVGDVQQAVDAAQVDEGAELGDVLDHALADLADLDLVEELLLHILPLILEQLAAADDDVAAGLVDLEDLALDGLADVVGNVGRTADVHLAGGQEDVDADVDQQAALDLAGDHAGDDVAFLVLGDDVFPFLLPFGFAIAQDDGSQLVFNRVEQYLNLFAGLRRHHLVEPFVVPFVDRDDAFALVADVHQHLIADDLNDPSGDDLVDLELLLFGRQPRLYVSAGVFPVKNKSQFLLEFRLRQIVLAE